MASPLFNSLNLGRNGAMGTNPPANPGGAGMGAGGPQMTIQDALRQVNEHPAECFHQAGLNVPAECYGNNQATVMHLLRSGQVGGPMMRMIAPLLSRLGVR